MLEIARALVGGAAEVRQITLPDDPLPDAGAIVAVGHPINYLADVNAIDRALIAIANALRADGHIAFLCARGRRRLGTSTVGLERRVAGPIRRRRAGACAHRLLIASTEISRGGIGLLRSEGFDQPLLPRREQATNVAGAWSDALSKWEISTFAGSKNASPACRVVRGSPATWKRTAPDTTYPTT